MRLQAVIWRKLPQIALALLERGFGIAAGYQVISLLSSRRHSTLLSVSLSVAASSIFIAMLLAIWRVIPSYDALKSLEETGYDLTSEFESSAFADRFVSEDYVNLRKKHLGY